MKITGFKRAALITIAALISMSLVGCNSSQNRRVLEMDARFVAALDAAQDGFIVAHSGGLMDDATFEKGQRVFVALAQSSVKIKDAIVKENNVSGAVDEITVAISVIDDFNKSGLIGVKNANTKAEISLGLQSLATILATAKALAVK